MRRSIVWKVLFVLLMCSAGRVQAAPYTDHQDGTVTDSKTGYMWQKEDDGEKRVWSDAIAYCDNLDLGGHNDWTLPKVYLLEGLVDLGNSPTIDPVFIVKPSYYWSSSISRNSDKSAKYINFYYGNTYTYSKNNTYFVLCARDGSQSATAASLQAGFSLNFDKIEPLKVSLKSEIKGGSEPYFFEWDFGDGETSSLPHPLHKFKQEGRYKIVLTVSDNDGATSGVNQEIVLSAVKSFESNPMIPEQLTSNKISTRVMESGDVVMNLKEASPEIIQTEIAPVKPAPVQLASLLGSTSEEKILPKISAQKVISEDMNSSEQVGILGENDKIVEKVKDIAAAPGTVGDLDVLPNEDTRQPSRTKLDSDSVDVKEQVQKRVPESTQPVKEQKIPEPAVSESNNLMSPSKVEIFAISDSKNAANNQNDQGLLAYSFANAINGDADWNKDGIVTVRELKGYISIAIENLSNGQQKPSFNVLGEDFSICAQKGSTYIFAAGIDSKQAGDALVNVSAAKNAETVRQAIAGKCVSSKTSILTGERATRAATLQALSQIGSMITPKDNLLLYFDGNSEITRERLNLYLYDTQGETSVFSGLFYDDLIWFVEEMKAANLLVLFEGYSRSK